MLPVDISLSADDKTLFVDCFGDGKCRVFDVSDPHKPKQIYEKQIGKQVNMVSQSWDGKRLYFTSSLLARWDKNRRRQRAVRARLRLGRQRTEAELRSRFHRAETRPPASHALRLDENRRSSDHDRESRLALSMILRLQGGSAAPRAILESRPHISRIDCETNERGRSSSRQRLRLRSASTGQLQPCRW